MKLCILTFVLAAASAAEADPTTYTYSGRTFVPGTTTSNVPSIKTGLINQAQSGEWMVYQNGRWEMGNNNAVHWIMDGPDGQWPPSGTWTRAPGMSWLNDRVGTCNNCPEPPHHWSNDPVFEVGDAPTCHVDDAGRTIVQYNEDIHVNGWKCEHSENGAQCSCTSSHPQHAHGGCMELDHLPSATNINEQITRSVGGDCEDQCHQNSCNGNGTCVDGDNDVHCVCNAGFYGDACENEMWTVSTGSCSANCGNGERVVTHECVDPTGSGNCPAAPYVTFSGAEAKAGSTMVWDHGTVADDFCKKKTGDPMSAMQTWDRCFNCNPSCQACQSFNADATQCLSTIGTCHSFNSITCSRPSLTTYTTTESCNMGTCATVTFSGANAKAGTSMVWDHGTVADDFCKKKTGHSWSAMQSWDRCFNCNPSCQACQSFNADATQCLSTIGTCHSFTSITCSTAQ